MVAARPEWPRRDHGARSLTHQSQASDSYPHASPQVEIFVVPSRGKSKGVLSGVRFASLDHLLEPLKLRRYPRWRNRNGRETYGSTVEAQSVVSHSTTRCGSTSAARLPFAPSPIFIVHLALAIRCNSDGVKTRVSVDDNYPLN